MLSFWIGYISDLVFGDPYWMPHPIRFIGLMINKIESWIRSESDPPRLLKIKGTVLLFLVVGISTAIPWALLMIAGHIGKWLKILLEAIMIYQILATKCLDVEAKKVKNALEKDDIIQARKAVSMLVSRDTGSMERVDIIKAVVETVTENIVDGIISPIFFIAIGGAPLGFAYKSVNTLDSMVGYKNEKYLDFGWASAKFDDVLNYIPARVTACLVIAAAFILRLDYKNAIYILKRDKKNHSSPNSPWSEAPAAGALRIELGGRTSYFGKYYDKPTMGDPLEKQETRHIQKASVLMYTTSFLGMLLATIYSVLIF